MDELTIRFAFLVIGIIIGWIAGMSYEGMRYARRAMDETHATSVKVDRLREDMNSDT